MYISDSKTLAKAINELNDQRVARENILLDKIYIIRQFTDPVYHVNKLLPKKVKAAEALDNLMDESLMDTTTAINSRLKAKPTDSFIKKAGSNLLQHTVSKTMNNNADKIKMAGLAILKTIFN